MSAGLRKREYASGIFYEMAGRATPEEMVSIALTVLERERLVVAKGYHNPANADGERIVWPEQRSEAHVPVLVIRDPRQEADHAD